MLCATTTTWAQTWLGSGNSADPYLYCVQHTLGSHVGIYNYQNFGNLYTTSPKDFFVKK